MIFKTLKAAILIATIVSIGSISFSNAFAANEQSVEELDQAQARIERQNNKIKDIQRRVNETDGAPERSPGSPSG